MSHNNGAEDSFQLEDDYDDDFLDPNTKKTNQKAAEDDSRNKVGSNNFFAKQRAGDTLNNAVESIQQSNRNTIETIQQRQRKLFDIKNDDDIDSNFNLSNADDDFNGSNLLNDVSGISNPAKNKF